MNIGCTSDDGWFTEFIESFRILLNGKQLIFTHLKSLMTTLAERPGRHMKLFLSFPLISRLPFLASLKIDLWSLEESKTESFSGILCACILSSIEYYVNKTLLKVKWVSVNLGQEKLVFWAQLLKCQLHQKSFVVPLYGWGSHSWVTKALRGGRLLLETTKLDFCMLTELLRHWILSCDCFQLIWKITWPILHWKETFLNKK